MTRKRELLQLLDSEVKILSANLSPRLQEIEIRNWVAEKIEWLVRKILNWDENECSVSVFGSLKTKLYLPQGDVDIVINHQTLDSHTILTKIHTALISLARNAPWNVCKYDSIELLLHIRIPLLKFKTRIGSLKVDVTANTNSGNISSQVVLKWVDTDYAPYLRPIILTLKNWLTKKGFVEVFTGGLGGYALVNMVVSVIQLIGIDALKTDEAPLGLLLVSFFEVFGARFDYMRKGISVNRGNFIEKPAEVYRFSYSSTMSRGDSGLRLYIEDPTDPTNNISKGTFRMDEIREAMLSVYVYLESALAGSEDAPQSSILDKIIFLDPAVEDWRDQLCSEWDDFVRRYKLRNLKSNHGSQESPQESSASPAESNEIVVNGAKHESNNNHHRDDEDDNERHRRRSRKRRSRSSSRDEESKDVRRRSRRRSVSRNGKHYSRSTSRPRHKDHDNEEYDVERKRRHARRRDPSMSEVDDVKSDDEVNDHRRRKDRKKKSRHHRRSESESSSRRSDDENRKEHKKDRHDRSHRRKSHHRRRRRSASPTVNHADESEPHQDNVQG